eukprot:scaffold528_cov165-Amphora_coffeaeformis.AAC.47
MSMTFSFPTITMQKKERCSNYFKAGLVHPTHRGPLVSMDRLLYRMLLPSIGLVAAYMPPAVFTGQGRGDRPKCTIKGVWLPFAYSRPLFCHSTYCTSFPQYHKFQLF